MKAKQKSTGTNALGLTKAQQAEVLKREEGTIIKALRSVMVAGTADGTCMIALHTIHRHGLKCEPAVRMAIEALGDVDANKDSLKSRKTKLLAVAEAADAGKMVMYKGAMTTVGSLLAKVSESGKIKPGSLQGVYAALKPTPEKTQAQHRDWVNEQVLQLMQRDPARGGGLWIIEASNAQHLRAEYVKAQAKAQAEIDAKVKAKALK